MNGTIKLCHQILVSLFEYFESSSLFCSNCHSLYFCSIMVTVVMARAVDCDFSLSVDLHRAIARSLQLVKPGLTLSTM